MGHYHQLCALINKKISLLAARCKSGSELPQGTRRLNKAARKRKRTNKRVVQKRAAQRIMLGEYSAVKIMCREN